MSDLVPGREFVALVIVNALEGDGSTEYLPDVTRHAAADYVLDAFEREGLRVVVVPRMPKAQRGTKVDHAVELVTDTIGRQGLRSLCGTLAPSWASNPIAVDTLPTFEPDADDACKQCRRYLPAELRADVEIEPKRTRRATVDLDGFVISGTGALDRFTSGAHPSTLGRVFEFDTTGAGVDQWPTLGELVRAAREHGETER